MAPQIVRLVEKLTELTSQNKIVWETTADEDTFLTSAGKSVVKIARDGGLPDAPVYRIQLLNEAGRVVEEAVASSFDEHGRYDPTQLKPEAALVGSLHELARRSALHADQAVADLLSSLEQIR